MEAEQMKQCMDAENLHRRLKKIIGRVQAIDRMIEKPWRNCFFVSASIATGKEIVEKEATIWHDALGA
mgnify:CR=1 FL=1